MASTPTHGDGQGWLFQALSIVEPFTGSYGRGEDAYAWLENIEELADNFDGDTAGCLKVARLRLAGPAKQWFTAVPRNRSIDWDGFKNAFLDRFGEKRDAMLARLSNCVQQDGEAVREYADRFRGLARRAGRSEDAALTHQFIKGLRPFLRKQAVLQRYTDLEQVIDYVNYLDEWDQQEGRTGTSNFAGRPLRNDFRADRGRPFPPRGRGAPTGYMPYREPFRPVFQHNASGNGSMPPNNNGYNNRDNFGAITGYVTPYRGPNAARDPLPRPMDRNGTDNRNFSVGPPKAPVQPRTAAPVAAPRTPERTDQKDLDDVTKELARMKLMYERDTGLQPPGPPACRLCQNIGHIARNCPYQLEARCAEQEENQQLEEHDYGDNDSYYEDGPDCEEDEMEEVYAAEKRDREFQVQTKPRKRIAFEAQQMGKPAGRRLTSPPPPAPGCSSFDHQRAIRPPPPPPKVKAEPGTLKTDETAKAGTDIKGLKKYQYTRPNSLVKPRATPANDSTGTKETAVAAARRHDVEGPSRHGAAPAARPSRSSPETKAQALQQIVTDYTRKPIVLDPVKHRNLSVKEINAAIAKRLLDGESEKCNIPAPKSAARPTGRQLPASPGPIDLTREHSGAWEHTAAALESDSDEGVSENGSEIEIPALIDLDSDSDDDNSDTSSEAASTDVDEETVPVIKMLSPSRPKPGQPHSFAPKKLLRRPVARYTSLRTTAFYGRHALETMIDSGASQSFINSSTVKNLGLGQRVRRASIKFMNADGCRSTSEGLIRGLTLVLGDLQITMDLHVTPGDRYDLLLGSNFLVPIGAKIDYTGKLLRYSLGQRSGAIKVNFKGWGRDCYLLSAETSPAQPPAQPPHTQETSTLLDTIRELDDDSDSTGDNGDHEDAQLADEEVLSQAEHDLAAINEDANEEGRFQGAWDDDVPPSWCDSGDTGAWGDLRRADSDYEVLASYVMEYDPWMFEMAPCLPTQHFEPVVILLDRYRHIFAADDSQLTQTDLVKHHIELLPGTTPIAQRPLRLSHQERQVVNQEVQKMLDAGIIRPSKSPWASPVVLVPKKDGGIRFTTDFRRLNAVTKRDFYPLPNITAILDDLGKAKWFSKIDMKSGYFTIKLDDESIERSAFVTSEGLYEYLVCPQGLNNSPATFQRLMNTIFRELIGRCILVYLDDIIVYTSTFEEHIDALSQVFQLLEKANIKAHLRKTEIGLKEVLYLGHIITEHGVKPDMAKIEAVQNFPRPRTVRDVRSFLGLCGYYRRFIKDFAKIAAPLTDLTGGPKSPVSSKRESPAVARWGEDEDAAFAQLKEALTSPPILRRPDFSRPFMVYTDWSTTAIGAILAQEDPDIPQGEYVVAYASRKLASAERNYSATEGECLAAVWAVKHFRCYLWGVQEPFSLITDHIALQWLYKNKDLNGRLTRWSLKLQEYNFSIKYRKGTAHSNVDALSRIPAYNDTTVDSEIEADCCVREIDVWDTADDTCGPQHDINQQQGQTEEAELPDIDNLNLDTVTMPEASRFVPLSANGPTLNLQAPGAADDDSLHASDANQLTAIQSDDWLSLLLGSGAVTQPTSSMELLFNLKELQMPEQGATAFGIPEQQGQSQQASSSWDLAPSLLGPPADVFNPPWETAVLGANGFAEFPPHLRYTFIISIEGNIGAGKTSILRMAEPLLQASGYEVVYEPVESMQKLLQDFYRSPREFGAILQVAICLAYHQLKCQSHSGPSPRVLIVERSPVSSLQVFAKNLLDEHVLTQKEYAILKMLFTSIGWSPDGMIYVRTPADICYSRLQHERAKGPDKQIPKEYLQQLECRHQQMLRYPVSNFSMILDGTQSLEYNVEELISFVDGAVRMGVYGVAPQPYPQVAMPISNWGPVPPFAEACVMETEELLTTKAEVQKDYSDTSTDPDIDPIACEVCKCQTNWAQMLLCDKCDKCDKGFHTGCLQPPLFRIPDDDWQCPGCTAGQEEATCTDTAEVVAHIYNKGAPDILDDRLTMAILMERHGIPQELSPPAGTTPEELQKAVKRARKRAKNYFIDQGNVYKLAKGPNEKPRRVPPSQERHQLLKEVHSLGHMGVTKCAQMLGKRLFWHNMYQDIAEYVRSCEVCKQRKVKFITYPELQSIEPEGLFSMVALDTLGAFPVSAAGNKYVVLCVEYYSRWVEARAIPDQKSATVAKFFEEEVICRHGCPATCITDNGSEFKLEFANLLTRNNIQHKHSAPFHPQGNGLAERCNQWMLRALQRKAADDATSWDQHIPSILFSYRICPSASLAYSPFFILYGREAILPGQLPPPDRPGIAAPPKEAEQQQGIDAAIKAHALKDAEHLPAAKSNLQQAQAKQKRMYRKRRAIDPEELAPVGSFVYLKRPKVKGKLGPKVEGPYKLMGFNDNKTTAYIQDGAVPPRTWAESVSRIAPSEGTAAADADASS